MENKYCNDCEFLSLTEEEQAKKREVAKANNTYLKDKINDFHYCKSMVIRELCTIDNIHYYLN